MIIEIWNYLFIIINNDAGIIIMIAVVSSIIFFIYYFVLKCYRTRLKKHNDNNVSTVE